MKRGNVTDAVISNNDGRPLLVAHWQAVFVTAEAWMRRMLSVSSELLVLDQKFELDERHLLFDS